MSNYLDTRRFHVETDLTTSELAELVVKVKSTDRKLEILTIASKHFAEYEYQGTTLEAIAAELGITRAALYRYFSSKDELLFKCHEVAYDHFLNELEQLKFIKNPQERLTGILKAHILLFLRDFSTFGSILLSIRSLPVEFRTKIIDLRMKVENIYLSCIQDWRKSDPEALKEMDDYFLLNVLLSSVNAVPRWNKQENKPETVAQQVVSILIDGIKNDERRL
jgi:AcrR family transcriptional regulator